MNERFQQTKKVTIVSAVVNFFLGLFKIAFGYLGNSAALVADGVHSLSDILADVFVYFAAKWGSAEADDDHPYGHRRIETVATFAIACLLTIVGIVMGYEAAMRLWHHDISKPDLFTVIVALFSVLANEGLFWYTLKTGKKIKSELLVANAYHSRGDSLTSVVVFFGLIGAQFGWVFLDAMAAILVAVYILRMGLKWGLKALYELTDAGLSEEDIRHLQSVIDSVDGVLHSHKLRTRKMAEQILLDVHIQVEPYLSVSEGHYVAECVRVSLAKANKSLYDITVHVDIEDHPEGIPDALPPSKEDVLKQLEGEFKKIVPLSQIKTSRLHYFYRRMELEVGLSTKVLDKHHAKDLNQSFAKTAKSVPYLDKVSVFFV